MFKQNDLVILKSDKKKIVYYVKKVQEQQVLLIGYIYRIRVTSTIDDIEYADKMLIEEENKILTKTFDQTIKQQKRKHKAIFGTILHIDSDKKFLDNCLNLYKEMKIHSWGVHIKEKDISNALVKILNEITPDIIVLTGHDYFNGIDETSLSNYENTKYFIDSLRVIRQRFNQDSVTVIAGACCSHFEALIANGANFASSPKRIHIHTYDPAIIAIKCATTSCNNNVDFNQILKYIENGKDAVGGIETKGKMKLLL